MRRKASALILLLLTCLIVNADAFSDSDETKLRALIISESEDLIGVPYVKGGSSERGFGPAGLVKYVYSKLSIKLSENPETMYKAGEKIHPRYALPGDLIFFSIEGKSVDYVAIYLGNQRFIHASPEDGKVTISYIQKNSMWGTKFVGVCTYKNYFVASINKNKKMIKQVGPVTKEDLGNEGESPKQKELENTAVNEQAADISIPDNESASKKDMRMRLVATAKKYLGVPYRWGGTTPAGFDCSGFMQYVFRENGISLPRTSSGQYSAGKKIEAKYARPGDLIFFYGEVRGRVRHVAMYIGNGQIIHSPSTGKVVSISTVRNEKYWGRRFHGMCTFVD